MGFFSQGGSPFFVCINIMKQKDIIGKKFGRLTVIKFSHIDKNKKHRYFICKCNCGNTKTICSYRLKYGYTKSCGCLRKELGKNMLTTHGMSKIKEYQTWVGIKARCINKKEPAYMNYGGRGIKICDRWKNSFENFYEDMGERPKRKSLDRIDNNGNYCKENCRWATRKEQQRNTRTNIMITYKGKTFCAKEWAEKLNIKYPTLYYRIKSGWNIERAFTKNII